jgi:dihydrofolate reductase
MRRIRYGVATSLDGFIAGPNGEYDWIVIDPDIDFAGMMAQFDTYLMGRRSYEVFQTTGTAPGDSEGGGGGGEVYVFSRTLRQEDHPGVTIVADGIEELLRELRARPGKDIWLWGGGQLFRTLLEMDQVDTVELAVVPVLLGEGVPLLASPALQRRLKLERHTVYPKTGTVALEYSVLPGKA